MGCYHATIMQPKSCMYIELCPATGLYVVNVFVCSAQGRNVAALETAKEVVGPHLGISLGLEAVKRLGGRYQAVAMKHTLAGLQQGSTGMAAVVESDIPHAGRDAEKGTGQDTLMPDQFDLQFQIIEALAARMADDGGQVWSLCFLVPYGSTAYAVVGESRCC